MLLLFIFIGFYTIGLFIGKFIIPLEEIWLPILAGAGTGVLSAIISMIYKSKTT